MPYTVGVHGVPRGPGVTSWLTAATQSFARTSEFTRRPSISRRPASERTNERVARLAGGRLADWDSVIADSPRTASRPTMYGQSPGRQLGELFKGKACELRDAGRQRLIEYHTLVDWP